MDEQASGKRMVRGAAMTSFMLFVILTTVAGNCEDKPSDRTLIWGILDKETNTNTDVPAGGLFTVQPAIPTS